MLNRDGSGRLSADISLDIEDLLVAHWREMSPAQKLALVRSAAGLGTTMALAGLRAQYPGASERELFLRLAVRRFGRETVLAVYADAHAYLDPAGR
jgi:hypothetical protein